MLHARTRTPAIKEGRKNDPPPGPPFDPLAPYSLGTHPSFFHPFNWVCFRPICAILSPLAGSQAAQRRPLESLTGDSMILLRLLVEHFVWIVWQPVRSLGWALPLEVYRRLRCSLTRPWYYCCGCGQLMSTVVSPGFDGLARVDGRLQVVGSCVSCEEAGRGLCRLDDWPDENSEFVWCPPKVIGGQAPHPWDPARVSPVGDSATPKNGDFSPEPSTSCRSL